MNKRSIDLSRGIIASYKPKFFLQKIRALLLEKTLRRIPKDDSILDFCCGFGFYFLINPRANGIDGDPLCAKYLKTQRKIIPLANVLDPLPFKNCCFSYVIAHDVFEHFSLEELIKIVGEIHRILAPQAILLVFVPNSKGYEYGVKKKVGHKTFITKREIETLIPGLFKLIEQYPEPLPRFIGGWFTHNKEVFVLKKV